MKLCRYDRRCANGILKCKHLKKVKSADDKRNTTKKEDRTMNATQQALMTETMKIVAEVGLDGLSMRQVAARVGVSNSIIYQYFGTKDNLLYECFMQFNREIGNFFKGFTIDEKLKGRKILQAVHDEWFRYFEFMVKSDFKSLFFYAYRESPYLERVLSTNNQTSANDLAPFFAAIQNVAKNYKIKQDVNHEYLLLFLVEGTGMFVKHVIRDHIPMEQVDTEKIFKLISGGVLSFMLS